MKAIGYSLEQARKDWARRQRGKQLSSEKLLEIVSAKPGI